MQCVHIVYCHFCRHVGCERTERKSSRVNHHLAVESGIKWVPRPETDNDTPKILFEGGSFFLVNIVPVVEVATRSEGREKSMPHHGHAVCIEIQVAFISQKRRIICITEDECLRETVVARNHFLAF